MNPEREKQLRELANPANFGCTCREDMRELFAEIDALRVDEKMLKDGGDRQKNTIAVLREQIYRHNSELKPLRESSERLKSKVDELYADRDHRIELAETLRSQLSEAIGLGNGADWEVIKEFATELATLYLHTYDADTDAMRPGREKWLRSHVDARPDRYPSASWRNDVKELLAEIDRLRGVQETRREAAQRCGDKTIKLEELLSELRKESHRRGEQITDHHKKMYDFECTMATVRAQLDRANQEAKQLRRGNEILRKELADKHAGHCDGNCGMSIAECAVTEGVLYASAVAPVAPQHLPQWLYERSGTYTMAWEKLTDTQRAAWRREANAVRQAVRGDAPAAQSDQGVTDEVATALVYLDALRDALRKAPPFRSM